MRIGIIQHRAWWAMVRLVAAVSMAVSWVAVLPAAPAAALVCSAGPVYSTPGDDCWVAPAGVTSVTVQVWGGGGRGGSTTSSAGAAAGGGGGGGAYSSKVVSVTPGNTYAIHVGAGSTTSAAGEDSYFLDAQTVMAKGGNSGADLTSGNQAGATGGAAASGVGTTKYSGGGGAGGTAASPAKGGGGGSSAGTGADGANGNNQNGGTAPSGGGNGGNGRNASSGIGSPGLVPGGGGGGALRTSSTDSNVRTGGAGAPGKVVLTYTALPDMTVSKDKLGVENAVLGVPFTWRFTIANGGPGLATFDQVDILHDDLPDGLTPGAITVTPVSGITGNPTCSISNAGGHDALVCTDPSGPSTTAIGPGGSFTVDLSVTPSDPSTAGSLANPRSGGICRVDPESAVAETNDEAAGTDNNGCTDTVTVDAPDLTVDKTDSVGGTGTLGVGFDWIITLSNDGNANAVVPARNSTNPDTYFFRDNLPPSSDIDVSGATIDVQYGGGTTGDVDCEVSGLILTCWARDGGGGVTLPPGGTVIVTLQNVIPLTTGDIVNPKAAEGSHCQVDPDQGQSGYGAVLESDENNNDVCSDTVSVTAATTITTQADPVMGTLNTEGTFGDTATVTGATGGNKPTGDVTFTLYSDDQCTVPVDGMSGFGTINQGTGQASFEKLWTPLAVGTYYWIAEYAGDDSNDAFTTKCGDPNEEIAIGDVGAIVIQKIADPNSETEFPFSGTGPNAYNFGGGFLLKDNGSDPNSMTFTGLVPGSYTVSEADPSGLGYLLTDLTCDDPTLNSAQDQNNSLQAYINLAAGETVTCTFTNTGPGGGDGGGGGGGRGAGQGRNFQIPSAGFTPGVYTRLGGQPASAAYARVGVNLRVPKLGLDMSVQGVPFVDRQWQIDWLTGVGGWLQQTAYPGLNGNSVIMSHVVTHYGSEGPFAHLNSLSAGDYIFVTSLGQQYVYEVKWTRNVAPDDMSVFKHETTPVLTLITCSDYNGLTQTYDGRLVVHAVLIAAQ